jgi:hypothetical protein
MAVGPTCQPTKNKNKNKDEFFFMARLGLKYFFTNLNTKFSQKYLIYRIHLHDQHARANFPQKTHFILGYKKEKDLIVYIELKYVLFVRNLSFLSHKIHSILKQNF